MKNVPLENSQVYAFWEGKEGLEVYSSFCLRKQQVRKMFSLCEQGLSHGKLDPESLLGSGEGCQWGELYRM